MIFKKRRSILRERQLHESTGAMSRFLKKKISNTSSSDLHPGLKGVDEDEENLTDDDILSNDDIDRDVALKLQPDDAVHEWLVSEKINTLMCRAQVVRKPYTSVQYPKERLHLFLRVRDYDVKRAGTLLDAYTKFYRKCGCEDHDGVPGYKRLNIVQVEASLATRVLSLPDSVDRNGNTLLVMRPRFFFPLRQEGLDNLLLSAMYLVECIIEDNGGENPLTFLADMDGWSRKNFSLTYAQRWFSMMQNAWPIRFGRFLLLDAPPWFGDIWRLIRPMMKKSFSEKVIFCCRRDLSKYVDPTQLPEDLGGIKQDHILNFIQKRYHIENIDPPENVKSLVISNISAGSICDDNKRTSSIIDLETIPECEEDDW